MQCASENARQRQVMSTNIAQTKPYSAAFGRQGRLKTRNWTSRDHQNCWDWSRETGQRETIWQGRTSRDLTTWHQIKQRCTIFMLHGIL